jgi:hypothetical protein
MDKSKSYLKQFLTSIVFIGTFGFATTMSQQIKPPFKLVLMPPVMAIQYW